MPGPDSAPTRTTATVASPSVSPSGDDDTISGSTVGDRLRTFLATRTSLGVTTLDCDPLARRAGARGSCRLVFSDGAGYGVDALVRDPTTTPPDLVFDLTLTTPIPAAVVETNVLTLLRTKFPGGAPVSAKCKPLGPAVRSRTTCLLTGKSGLVYAADVTLAGWNDAVPMLAVQVAATPTSRPI